MATGRVNVGGGGAGLNIFTQMSEPAIKEGIWLKTNHKYKKVIVDNNTNSGAEWNDVTSNPHPDLPGPKLYANGVLAGDIFYIPGGNGAIHNSIVNTFYAYDTINRTWSTLPTMPYLTSLAAVFYYENKIYVHSGYRDGGFINFVQVFDFSSNTWTVKSISNLWYGEAVVYGDYAFIFGTTDGQIYKYDIINNINTATGVYVNKYAIKPILVDNEVYLISGAASNSRNSVVTSAMKVNLDTLTTTTLAPIQTGIALYSAELIEGKIYCFGGSNGIATLDYNTQLTDSISIYDIATDTWENNAYTMPFKKYAATSFYKDGAVYIIGGAIKIGTNQNTPDNSVRSFTVISKVYPDDSLILIRDDNFDGLYKTELVTPSIKLTGIYTRLLTSFNDALFYDTELRKYERYYGDGTQWIKFKEANQ